MRYASIASTENVLHRNASEKDRSARSGEKQTMREYRRGGERDCVNGFWPLKNLKMILLCLTSNIIELAPPPPSGGCEQLYEYRPCHVRIGAVGHGEALAFAELLSVKLGLPWMWEFSCRYLHLSKVFIFGAIFDFCCGFLAWVSGYASGGMSRILSFLECLSRVESHQI